MVIPEGARVAVVGAGISGIVSAYLLSRIHRVTLFEANDYLGGHTNTRVISDGPDAGTAVDTGFIVCNPRNYPNFYAFLRQLGVGLQDTEMSFGFSCERTGHAYLGPSLKEFLKAPENLLRPRFLRLFLEQRRFNKHVLADLQGGRLGDCTLGDYVDRLGVDPQFMEDYLVPLLAAIWSSPDLGARQFPAETFATFFKNHGMLELNTRPQWQTVVGGSHSYVKAFQRNFQGEVRMPCVVKAIERNSESVTVRFDGEESAHFDYVVMATHADQARRLLKPLSAAEDAALSAWSYSKNETVLHRDPSVLPPAKRLWASWNYRRRVQENGNSPVAVTYDMNRLQRLRAVNNYLVSLNTRAQIAESRIVYETTYEHPVYTSDSVASQNLIRSQNGAQQTFFCGAYLGYGFHEDGVLSAVEVARHFGVAL